MMHRPHHAHFARDGLIIAVSIVGAYLLAESHIIERLITDGYVPLQALIVGFFFTSLLTIAPAGVAFAEMGQTIDPVTLSLWGAAGAVVGDLLLFFFIRDSLSEDMLMLLRGSWGRKITALFHTPYLSWAIPLCGALVIASPLPDELGIAMLGLSKTDLRFLIPISYAMNFLGIFLVTWSAHAL